VKLVFTTVVLLYLLLDFGALSLPGAVSFDLDESVEAVQLPRDPAPAPPRLTVTREPLFRLAPVRIAVHAVRRDTCVRPVPLELARRLAPDPSGPEEG
jgi:hypothetical protein